MRKYLYVLITLVFTSAFGQQRYYPPSDSLVQRKLQWWGNLKFGLLMHWGTYSQWGIVESWSLCPEDEGWCQRKGPYAANYFEYKKAYENLKTTFNPVKFNPDKWAKAAKDAGMRYVVFTTKHHDGFCMFDTKQTDYKITDPACPFSSNPGSNVAREIFDAFRKQGLGIGAYFSKPDWHCSDYWSPYFPPFDRNVNYDIKKYPEKWEAFKTFTFNQIKELMSDYGRMDILWLDGGWVQPVTTSSPREGKGPIDQNIDMPKIAAMARSLQPGLIVVDRAVEGEYQNYLTPEQEISKEPLPYPWETCMTMATSWSYVPHDTYKPARRLVHLLAQIVSRGGNFLLNIGPGPDGELDSVAYSRLKELGAWMSVNSEAIYGTHPIAPYQSDKVVFTSKDDGSVFAIYMAGDNEHFLPAAISLGSFFPKQGNGIILLGAKGALSWEKVGENCIVHVSDSMRNTPPCDYAWVLKITR
ncbi:MAG: alpha-L-fucosidase [Bacteroidota bacterium]|jgi:alpha-L-fucosidase